MALPRFFFSIFLTSLLFTFIFPSPSSAEYAGIKRTGPPSPRTGLYQAKRPETSPSSADYASIKRTGPPSPRTGLYQAKSPETSPSSAEYASIKRTGPPSSRTGLYQAKSPETSPSSAEYASIKRTGPPSPWAGLYQAKSPETSPGSYQVEVPEYRDTKPSNTAEPSKVEHYPVKLPKVNLSVYYEALCPYSAAFIKNDLVSLFEEDLIDIVDLQLVPWGNAHLDRDNKTIICQHGPDECYLNCIEACAINIWPEVKKHFKFIHCVERHVLEHKQLGEHTWRSCCQELGLSPNSISACYKSGHGREFLLRYSEETSRLYPPHTYVPWVVVNNFPIHDDFKNFVHYVCKAYTGHLRLRACEPFSNKINLDGAGNPKPADNDAESEKIPVHYHAKLRGRSSVLEMEPPA